MLMFTRRRGECVDIFKDGEVVVTVKVSELLPNGVVRLGFSAAPEYVILRDNAKERSMIPRTPGQGDGPVVTYRTRKGRNAPS